MKRLTLLLLLCFCLTSRADDGGDAGWLYTLAVGNGVDHFSVSLMKEGWISFDRWGEGKAFLESRIDLPEEQSVEVQKRFEVLFQAMARVGGAEAGAGIGIPSFTLEKVSNGGSVTHEFSGHSAEVEAFLDFMRRVINQPFPVDVRAVPDS